MYILAIDASTKASGVAVFDNNQLINWECIIQNNINVLTRINDMVQQIQHFYLKFSPEIVVMEDILPSQVGHNQSIYKALMYLQAEIVMMFHKYNITVELVAASHWRKNCGIKTGAGITREQLKQKSMKLVKALYSIDVNDDVSDAICLGISYIKEHKKNVQL